MKTRCKWAGNDPLYIQYHDTEWGVPVHDDRKLFEFLILEGAQAGLSWITILKKRENYRNAYENFNPRKMAEYNADKINSLLTDKGIIRNRLKIESAIQNAKSFLTIQKEFGSFDAYTWQFTKSMPIKNMVSTTMQDMAINPGQNIIMVTNMAITNTFITNLVTVANTTVTAM